MIVWTQQGLRLKENKSPSILKTWNRTRTWTEVLPQCDHERWAVQGCNCWAKHPQHLTPEHICSLQSSPHDSWRSTSQKLDASVWFSGDGWDTGSVLLCGLALLQFRSDYRSQLLQLNIISLCGRKRIDLLFNTESHNNSAWWIMMEKPWKCWEVSSALCCCCTFPNRLMRTVCACWGCRGNRCIVYVANHSF